MRKRIVKYQNIRVLDKKDSNPYWNWVNKKLKQNTNFKELLQANPDNLIDLKTEDKNDFSINSEALDLTIKQLPQILTESQYDTYVLVYHYGWPRKRASKKLDINLKALESRIKIINKKIQNQFYKCLEGIKKNVY